MSTDPFDIDHLTLWIMLGAYQAKLNAFLHFNAKLSTDASHIHKFLWMGYNI